MPLAERTVSEILLRWPESGPVLEARGIDTCCGGMHTLKDAAAAHEVPLEDVLAELAESGVSDAAPEASGEVVVDVREVVPRDRHPLIFSTFDGLPAGGMLTLVNDHDPKPLFYQFQAERTGQASWEPVEEGPQRWVIHIRKTA